MPMLFHAASDDGPIEDIEGGEQRVRPLRLQSFPGLSGRPE